MSEDGRTDNAEDRLRVGAIAMLIEVSRDVAIPTQIGGLSRLKAGVIAQR